MISLYAKKRICKRQNSINELEKLLSIFSSNNSESALA